MSLQVKPSLIIVGTLLLGMVIGTLVSSVFVNQRFDRIRDMMGPHAFPRHILETIGPLEDEQRDAVFEVVERAADRIRNESSGTRVRIHAVLDSMVIELEPLLTDQQLQELKRKIGERRKFMHRPHGKPPCPRRDSIPRHTQ